MQLMSRLYLIALPAIVLLALVAGCSSSHFETPELQGGAALVNDAGTPRLWVVTKQEESRIVSISGGGTHSSNQTRNDTYFHFDVQAYDPVATTPLWKQRLLTIGDPNAKGTSSLVIGSDVDAKLLGQDGELVWLLIGDAPFALNAADGSVAVNAETLQQINPALQGLLPSEAKYFGFDRGLVIMTADARQFVVRGNEHKVETYLAPPPPTAPEGPLQANGTREIVPLVPPGDIPARHVTLGGKQLWLYTEKEAADATNDEWGRNLRYPYTVLNEGKLARRTLLNATIDTVRRFDDRFGRIAKFTSIADAPTFLYGRFAKDAGTGNARVLEDPEGVLVWYSTRIDDAGRVALARLDAKLATVWRSELPLSESNFSWPLVTWWLPTHLVIVGTQQVEQGGATQQIPYLVSINLALGTVQSTPLAN